MKSLFIDYLNDNIKLEKYQMIGIMCLIIVISGIFGWIYEFIFYYFNGGMKDFYMQGGNFLPWINIYATGAIMIFLLTYKKKRNPLLVFLIGIISTGLLEYISGFIIYNLFDGLRLWNYNTEILNFGNIDGFVCLRSVLFFGVSSLILMYFILPLCIYVSVKVNKKIFLTISLGLCLSILFDEFYNLLIARFSSLPSACDIYKSLGFKYVRSTFK